MRGSKRLIRPAVGFIFTVSVVTTAAAQIILPPPVTGKVAMEDGSPPPEPVKIYSSSCPGAGLVGRTDSKGTIVLEFLGGGSESEAGSVVRSPHTTGILGGSARGEFGLVGCELEARLDGYQSGSTTVVAGSPDLGVIVLHPLPGAEGLTTTVTSLAAPKAAREAFFKADEAIQKRNWDEARQQLEKAVKIYPKYALAWFELGRVHQAAGDMAQARNAYEQAVQADPRFIKPYLELMKIYNHEQNWRATAEVTAAVIKLDPSSYPLAYVLNAMSNVRLGNLEAAEVSARQAIRLDSTHVYPEAEYTLGIILAQRGDYKGAAEHLRNYLQFAPSAPNAETAKKQLARAEELAAAQPAAGQAAPR